MSVKALSDFTRYAKYSKYLEEEQRRETWHETIDRVFDMHKQHLGEERYNAIKDEIEFAKKMVLKKRVLGSQRALQFGGEPILRKSAKMYNCSAGYVNRLNFFKECVYLLLCGCGVGFSVQRHHVAKLFPVVPARDKGTRKFTVPDTIEGWADCIGVLMQSFLDDPRPFKIYDGEEVESFSGYEIEFDFSKIRPEGAPISWGGVAPGPKGLEVAVQKITRLLTIDVQMQGITQLRPIHAYDIVMHASDAVLSGGIRRSATICMFSPDDEEMVTAKTGNWFETNPQRGRSNNSAVLVREETTREQFAELMKSVKEFGEPGFVWADSTEVLYNPCCISGDSWVTTKSGAAQVKDLVGKPLEILTNGKYEKSPMGFWSTGKKTVYRLTLANGMAIKATADHRFLKEDGQWTELIKLKRGDVVQISNNIETNTWEGIGGTLKEGWLLGNLIGDGTYADKDICKWSYWGNDRLFMIKKCKSYLKQVVRSALKQKEYIDESKNTEHPTHCNYSTESLRFQEIANRFGVSLSCKQFTEQIEKASSAFYRGVLGGLFDADGCVWGGNQTGLYVSIGQSNELTLQIAQRMLARFGIVSKIYLQREEGPSLLPDGKGGEKYYHCKAQYELRINGRFMVQKFFDSIHVLTPEKLSKYDTLVSQYTKAPYVSKALFTSAVHKIEEIGVEEVYDCTVPTTSCFDANGLIVHNCEIGLYAHTDDGRSGFEFCNLCEINGKKTTTREEFLEVCRAAAILGTIQASYDTFDYLSPATEEIVKKEALLGVSMTGVQDTPEITLNPEIQNEGAKLILEVNEEIAAKIGINKCARATCVKPAGTTSCILGTASGIHPHHAKRYFRRVQANKLEFPLQYFHLHNPDAVEDSVWSTNGTDQVITFLCEVPMGAKTKNQIGALDLLSNVKETQQNWVESGTRKDSNSREWLRHNVSNTINVQPNEWDAVEEYIYENRAWFAGVSLLPQSGDLDYPQAPFTSVLTHREICEQFGEGAMFASGLIVDGLHAFKNNLWDACNTALGIGEQLDNVEVPKEPQMPVKNGYNDRQYAGKLATYAADLQMYHDAKDHYDLVTQKKDWVRRFKQFAKRYVEGDEKRCSHLLKHVHNWKLWLDLKRTYIDIDWSLAVETNYALKVDSLAGEACSGGQCELGELGASIKKKTNDRKTA